MIQIQICDTSNKFLIYVRIVSTDKKDVIALSLQLP